ncbi:MAG: dephospho-CoA kinase [Solirubrobacterales bacterium]
MASAAPPQAPVLVGLTGAVAAGKSEALAALERLGAATLSSDAVVHELLETERVRDLLVGRWGPEVAPEGRIDRAQVGEIVFARPDELGWLEATLHPLVGERIAAWAGGLPASARIAVVEVPLLFETGMDGHFDATISVIAPEAVRAERAGTRDAPGLAGRTGRQLTQEEKAKRATYVVRNDGSLDELEAELARLLADLEAGSR